ncbi:MAG: exodeoxyribonuclease V beta subunit, partial [Myxococcota bacterium]
MNQFEPTKPLEKGITLLEASAGTGKTYSITNLVLQLIALHAVPLREVLLVTFTRNATAELRERVRLRLQQASVALRTGLVDPGDPVLMQVVNALATDDSVGLRVQQALEGFDECVIRTIHGFCQRMLQQFAAVAGADVDLELDPNADDLLDDVVDDWLSLELYPNDPQRFGFLTDRADFNRDTLLGLARTVVGNPALRIHPQPLHGGLNSLRAAYHSFTTAWANGWREEVVALIAQAHADKRFTPRQRTYTAKTAPRLVEAVDQWLLLDNPFVPLPTDAEKLREQSLAEKTVGEPIQHEALTALEQLASLPETLAAHEQARFAMWVRERFARLCEAKRIQPYAELVRGLADCVRPTAEPRIRQAMTEAIGGAFQAALIDEFQDTDDAQWTLFREVFGKGEHWLYLIGDPKQAIYGFRGANVRVYLQARESAGERVFTMTRNYRSDAGLLHAMNHLMDTPGFFGGNDIEYVSVDAPPRSPTVRLTWSNPSLFVHPEPLQVRVFDATTNGDAPSEKGLPDGKAKPLIAQVTALDVVNLLTSAPSVHTSHGPRPLTASDIAVLVRTGAEGDAIQAALTARGVPSVQTGRRSVFASLAARELQQWLAALVHSGRDAAARAAGVTRMFGYTADVLVGVEAQDPTALVEWDGWLTALAEWRELLEAYGFLRALRRAMSDHNVRERLLAHHGGERHLTDLLHVAELTHTAQLADDLHGAGLLAWLIRARQDAGSGDEEAEVRLERDDDAVVVMTIHKSKGLQFPVVFAPFLWSQRKTQSSDWVIAPEDSDPAARVLDLTRGSDSIEAAQRQVDEEALRLFYVAVTRAQYRLILYSGHAQSLNRSAMAAVLHGQSPDRISTGQARATAAAVPLLSDVESRLQHPESRVSACPRPIGSARWSPPRLDTAGLAVRIFRRKGLDRLWKRYSYTALTRNKAVSYAVPADREGFDPDRMTPAVAAEHVPVLTVPEDSPDVPLAGFPAGAQAGIFLHEVFENVDFQDAKNNPSAVREEVDQLLGKHGFDIEHAESLTSGLVSVLQTPLGGPLNALRLCDVPRAQRFDELRFDFPLAGGNAWGRTQRATVQSSAIIEAIQQHPVSPAMRESYLRGLSALDLGALAGFMTGSIDLVFRDPGEDGRWYVADYKSNRIDPLATRRYPIEHFALEPMRYEMEQHHYYLQYHLYTLALHRYLRWRIPDYDYDTHIGGVYYLFFR